MDSDNTGLSDVIDELESELDTLTTRLEALEGEHEAVAAVLTPPGRFWFTALATAHDNAERVMKP